MFFLINPLPKDKVSYVSAKPTTVEGFQLAPFKANRATVNPIYIYSGHTSKLI